MAFVLCLEFPIENEKIETSTLSIVLITIAILGGGTLPLLKVFKVEGANTADHLSEDLDAKRDIL